MGDPTAGSVLNYRCCSVPKPLCCLCLGAAFWLSRRTEGLAAVISRGLDRPGSLGNSSWGPLSLKQNLLLLRDVNLKINATFIAYCKCTSQHGALQPLLVIALLIAPVIPPWCTQTAPVAVTLQTSMLRFKFCFSSRDWMFLDTT